jgi:TolB protein
VLKPFLIIIFISVTTFAQSAPLRITITEGVIEPLPYAVPAFIGETGASNEVANKITELVKNDLLGTGLFREVPKSSYISGVDNFRSTVQYSDWKAINVQALLTGSVLVTGENLSVNFRLFDIFSNSELGKGLQFNTTKKGWRRIAHKIADEVYSRITGEQGYFDSRVVYVAETGKKGSRRKRLAIMDFDGANSKYLTDGSYIVLAPRFSPAGERVLYTSYETGTPQIYTIEIATAKRTVLKNRKGTMSFAPRFSPDGQSVVYSLEQGGNTDIYIMNLRNSSSARLTSAPSIETAPSFSPDGSKIVFESDRSGAQQLYVMSSLGGSAKRISSGDGRYGTPVWSPRGDRIAFTKQSRGRFHIGVMRVDGSKERLLTASFLDEGPTWSPNGRVIMFTRETQGERGVSALYSVDVSGRNLKKVTIRDGGSDPSWSPLGK